MAGPRKAKHDIAPAIRAAFLKGFDKYCREKGITYSDAMKEMIQAEGLGFALDRVSKFAVRENTVKGTVDHAHKHTHIAVSEVNNWLKQFAGQSEDSNPETIDQDGSVLSLEIWPESSRH